jgi:hypothetical protein
LLLNGTTIARWIGESGDWSDSNHWDIGVVPNNGGGNSYAAVIDVPGNDAVITIDRDISITGLTNSEFVRVAAGSTSVSLTIFNSGTIEVAGGVFNAGGTFTRSDLGNLRANGGTVNLTGTLDNTGTTLALDATTGTWNLAGGKIKGGTIAPSTGGAQLTCSSGILDGARLAADLRVSNGGWLEVRSGLEFNGVISGSNGPYTLSFLSSQALSGRVQSRHSRRNPGKSRGLPCETVLSSFGKESELVKKRRFP